MPDNNFLDELGEDDIDLTIFDEEEDLPEETLVESEGVLVDTITGEVVEEGPEAGLPANIPPEEPKAAMSEKEVLGNMDDLGLTTDPKDFAEGVAPKAPESPPVASEPEKDKPAPDVPAIKAAALESSPMGNAIQRAISLMEFKHVKELDPLFVKFEDCNFGEFTPEIEEAQAIIDHYYIDGYEAHAGRAEHDLGKLSAIMARIGRAAGYFQGSGERYEDVSRTVRAACYTELKEIRDEHGVKVSDKDADEVGRVLAGKFLKDQGKIEVIGKMVTNFWFAARKFIDILEGIIIRNRSENKVEGHTEAAARRQDPDAKPAQVDQPDLPVLQSATEPEGITDDGCDF